MYTVWYGVYIYIKRGYWTLKELCKFFSVLTIALEEALGASLMLNKLSNIRTTNIIYGSDYDFLQSQARGTLVMFNAANAVGITDALRKAQCEKYDLSRVEILPILDDTSFSRKAMLEGINRTIQVAWLRGCKLLLPSKARVHSARQDTRMVKLGEIIF